MCKVLKINRSTVYKIFKSNMSLQEIDRLDLENRLIDLYNEFDGIYGAPKLQKELLKQGYHASIKRVSRYMKRLGLRSLTIKKYNPGSYSKAPNDKINLMNREFQTQTTNEKWVMDITYIHTIYDGWTYLASVMDLHSKMIIGYHYNKRMTKEIVLESIRQAIYKTKETKGIIVQSDLGSQYLSYEVEDLLTTHGSIQSYSRKGNPADNSPIEAFHSVIKREYVHRQIFKNYDEAKLGIFKYIEGFYNRKRIHGSIGYKTPIEVYY